jgi:hypothetical protein
MIVSEWMTVIQLNPSLTDTAISVSDHKIDVSPGPAMMFLDVAEVWECEI